MTWRYLIDSEKKEEISALLTGDILAVVICQWGVRVEMRALCVAQGAPQPLQEESGPSETGTQSIVRDKFDALGVHYLFLLSVACNASGRQGENFSIADW